MTAVNQTYALSTDRELVVRALQGALRTFTTIEHTALARLQHENDVALSAWLNDLSTWPVADDIRKALAALGAPETPDNEV